MPRWTLWCHCLQQEFYIWIYCKPPKCCIAHPVALGSAIQDGQWCQQGHSLGNTSSRTPKSQVLPSQKSDPPRHLQSSEDQLCGWSCSEQEQKGNLSLIKLLFFSPTSFLHSLKEISAFLSSERLLNPENSAYVKLSGKAPLVYSWSPLKHRLAAH